ARWELTCAQIGVVTDDGLARVRDGAEVVAELPIDLLMTPPLYELAGKESEEVQRLRAYPLARLPDPGTALTLNPSPTRGEGGGSLSPSMGEGLGVRASPARWHVPPELHARMAEVAAQLRKQSTPSEALLWSVLRGRAFNGRKFRRQQPIGPFIVDFLCPEERLVIEVDGPIHATQLDADRRRQEIIESLGLRFLRLKAADVEANLEGALDRIKVALNPHPPAPSPTRGEGGEFPSSLPGEVPGARARVEVGDEGKPLPSPFMGEGSRVRAYNAVLLRLLGSPNLASRQWVYRQYDHQVMTNTVVAPGADAAVLRIRGTQRAVALTSDCNGRWCYLDPYVGGAAAVAEAARNLACVGARPLAVTDCLNFGNPERPEIAHQLQEAVRGLATACRALDVPVISGNVSLYNESQTGAIYPTPTIGMAGLLEDVAAVVRPGFRDAGDVVLLLGDDGSGRPEDLAGSEYLSLVHGLVAGAPCLDLDRERRLHHCCLGLAEAHLLRSAHDCAEGGLAVALAECCIQGGIGLDAAVARFLGRADAALFGERASRIAVSVAPERADDVIRAAARHGLPWLRLGTIGGDRIRLGAYVDVEVAEAARAWHDGLPIALGENTQSEPRP
ncbi:MAG: DUF559 domain-containing protein, partial [Chloroflexi bacterium]|nr:DUF559 domain-containing protein [Chloroflexota bacterium]